MKPKKLGLTNYNSVIQEIYDANPVVQMVNAGEKEEQLTEEKKKPSTGVLLKETLRLRNTSVLLLKQKQMIFRYEKERLSRLKVELIDPNYLIAPEDCECPEEEEEEKSGFNWLNLLNFIKNFFKKLRRPKPKPKPKPRTKPTQPSKPWWEKLPKFPTIPPIPLGPFFPPIGRPGFAAVGAATRKQATKVKSSGIAKTLERSLEQGSSRTSSRSVAKTIAAEAGGTGTTSGGTATATRFAGDRPDGKPRGYVRPNKGGTPPSTGGSSMVRLRGFGKGMFGNIPPGTVISLAEAQALAKTANISLAQLQKSLPGVIIEGLPGPQSGIRLGPRALPGDIITNAPTDEITKKFSEVKPTNPSLKEILKQMNKSSGGGPEISAGPAVRQRTFLQTLKNIKLPKITPATVMSGIKGFGIGLAVDMAATSLFDFLVINPLFGEEGVFTEMARKSRRDKYLKKIEEGVNIDDIIEDLENKLEYLAENNKLPGMLMEVDPKVVQQTIRERRKDIDFLRSYQSTQSAENTTPTRRDNYSFGYDLPPTNTIPGQNYGASRSGGTRKHAGVDFDISGPNATFASQIGGRVIFAGDVGGGYGNVVDIYNEKLGVTERIAEAAQILPGVKKGAIIQPGQVVVKGESNTGVIHYEIRDGIATASGSFEGTQNPIEFLKKNVPKTEERPEVTPQSNKKDEPEVSSIFRPINKNTEVGVDPITEYEDQMAPRIAMMIRNNVQYVPVPVPTESGSVFIGSANNTPAWGHAGILNG